MMFIEYYIIYEYIFWVYHPVEAMLISVQIILYFNLVRFPIWLTSTNIPRGGSFTNDFNYFRSFLDVKTKKKVILFIQ